MTSRNYQDLHAWQRAMDLTVAVYEITRRLPSDERFGLVAQLRRAAVSVPSNIAEGQGRGTENEMLRFFSIAHGSLREVETQLLLCARLGYVDQSDLTPSLDLAGDVGRLLNGLRRHFASS